MKVILVAHQGTAQVVYIWDLKTNRPSNVLIILQLVPKHVRVHTH
jgi:hypothetical protein